MQGEVVWGREGHDSVGLHSPKQQINRDLNISLKVPLKVLECLLVM